MIEDRTDVGTGDSFIVTGCIGPGYRPKLFESKQAALAYAQEIDRQTIWPPYRPVIENRWHCDVPSLYLNKKENDK